MLGKLKKGHKSNWQNDSRVSLSFVKRVLRRYRTSGQAEAKPRGATLAPTLDGAALMLVRRLIKDKPDISLAQLCEQLQECTQIKVSKSTMCRAVQRLERPRKNTVC